MSALTRADLDDRRCDACGQGGAHDHHPGPLWLHAKCHPDDALVVRYQAGVLSLFCAVCGEPVGSVAVAP